MPLNKASLKTAIKNAFDAEKESTDPTIDSIDRIASAIADGIDLYVKSGTVTTTVVTAGSATAQTGTGTGTIT
tara:strand:- start:1230 stop:1448 length:219 start_codon:yes stop_codon:yes gene_type:complete